MLGNRKSRIKRKRSKFKNAAKNLFKHDINRVRGLEMLENFLVKTHFLKSESFAGYCSGNIGTKRRIIAHILNLILMYGFVEYALISLINEPYIHKFFGNPTNLLVETRTIPLLFASGGFLFWLLGIN
jgi:hypothetical protein